MPSFQNLTFFMTPDRIFSVTHGLHQLVVWPLTHHSTSLGLALRYIVSILKYVELPRTFIMKTWPFAAMKIVFVLPILPWPIRSRYTKTFVGDSMATTYATSDKSSSSLGSLALRSSVYHWRLPRHPQSHTSRLLPSPLLLPLLHHLL